MTVMYSFCIWFPVRLGAVIVGVSAAVQSLACISACCVGKADEKETQRVINDWLLHDDLLITKQFFTAMRDDPSRYMNGFISAISIHLATCILLIIGAYRCTLWLIYPFVGLDFVRLVILSACLIVALLLVKANTITLGLIISCSIGGGFLLLYFWYQWFCVVSLCQIIREVSRMEEATVAVSSFHPSTISSKKDWPIAPAFTPYSHNIPLKPFYGLRWNHMDLPRPN